MSRTTQLETWLLSPFWIQIPNERVPSNGGVHVEVDAPRCAYLKPGKGTPK